MDSPYSAPQAFESSPVRDHELPPWDEGGTRTDWDAQALVESTGLTLTERCAINQRDKSAQYRSVDDAVDLFRRSKNIIVITGAGISTSASLPDFRSSTGLYSKVLQKLFSLKTFKEDLTTFYKKAKKVLLPVNRCTPTHAFLALLHDKLRTIYTQNIDNIKALAGIRSDKLIQCHGSLEKATCQ